MRSATSGVLMRLVAMSGIATSPLSLRVTHAKAARGTEVAIVGTRASCQPMPVLMIVAPAPRSPSPAARPRPSSGRRGQVEHRQAVDDDEVAAHGLARAPHDLHRQAHAALEVAAPVVVARLVRSTRNSLMK
jgi:hypothetical protein